MGTPQEKSDEGLSPRWKFGVILTLIIGFTVLIWIAYRAYEDAPPIPERIINPAGQTLITGEDILAGQQVFLRYGLMENGTIWGHGAYLGPDFSAQYLHTLGMEAVRMRAMDLYGKTPDLLTEAERDLITGDVSRSLKSNRYDPETKTLTFTDFETTSFRIQIKMWTAYFSQPVVIGVIS